MNPLKFIANGCGTKPPTPNTILITPASGAAHLSEQSRRPASNQRAADRAAVDPPFPAKKPQLLNGQLPSGQRLPKLPKFSMNNFKQIILSFLKLQFCSICFTKLP